MVENISSPIIREKPREAMYRPGQQAFYKEDGDLIRVSIVENNCSNEELRYTLKVEEHISKELGTLLRMAPVGNIFECYKVVEAPACFGIWALSDKARE